MLKLWQGSWRWCPPKCFGIWFSLHLKLSRYISTRCHHSRLSMAVILNASPLTKVCSNISDSLMTKSAPAQSRGKGGSEKENRSCSLSLHIEQRNYCLGVFLDVSFYVPREDIKQALYSQPSPKSVVSIFRQSAD